MHLCHTHVDAGGPGALGFLCCLLQDASRQASPPPLSPRPGPPRRPSRGAVTAELLCIIHWGRWALEPLCVGRRAERMGGFFARRLGRLGLAALWSQLLLLQERVMGCGGPQRGVWPVTQALCGVRVPGGRMLHSALPPLVVLSACCLLVPSSEPERLCCALAKAPGLHPRPRRGAGSGRGVSRSGKAFYWKAARGRRPRSRRAGILGGEWGGLSSQGHPRPRPCRAHWICGTKEVTLDTWLSERPPGPLGLGQS